MSRVTRSRSGETGDAEVTATHKDPDSDLDSEPAVDAAGAGTENTRLLMHMMQEQQRALINVL